MAQPKGREPGVYIGLSMDDYHADPAIGSSGIKNLLKSPELYWHKSPLNPDREQFDTVAFKNGRAYHLMVLEPEKDFPFEIMECKSSKLPGIIGRGDYDMLLLMYKRLLQSPRAWNCLHGGIAEVSIFWRDKESGLMCKIRPDMFAPEWVGDLKTCADVYNGLRYDFVKYGYHISGTMYSEGMLALKEMIRAGYQMPPEFSVDFVSRFMARDKQIFAFIFQQKDRPFTVRLWTMTPYTAEIGHHKFMHGLAVYLAHQDREGPWPSGFPDIENITEDMVSQSIQY